MMNKMTAGLLIGGICVLCGGCGAGDTAAYVDGTYTGQSSVFKNEDGTEDGNGYGEVSITIKDNMIVECTYQTFEENGVLKDDNYGKASGSIENRDFYNKAQKAVASCGEYANLITQSGSLEGIDAISGATINYTLFEEAINDALEKAEEKQG